LDEFIKDFFYNFLREIINCNLISRSINLLIKRSEFSVF